MSIYVFRAQVGDETLVYMSSSKSIIKRLWRDVRGSDEIIVPSPPHKIGNKYGVVSCAGSVQLG